MSINKDKQTALVNLHIMGRFMPIELNIRDLEKNEQY
jgi:transcription antitermination factor NusG